jgi:hypothetical protein
MKRTLIVAMVALLALPAFAQRSKTRRSTKRIKKTRKAKRVNINNSLQIEGSYEAISLGTNTSATNNIGQTAILGGDNSTNGMRLTVRQNYALSNNFFTSFGIGVRNLSSTSTGRIALAVPTYTATTNINELFVEQRMGKLFSLGKVAGMNLRIRPFAAISLAGQQSSTDNAFSQSNTSINTNTTNLVLNPSIGAEVIILNNLSATLSYSQSTFVTKGTVNSGFGAVESINSARNTANALSLSAAYSF